MKILYARIGNKYKKINKCSKKSLIEYIDTLIKDQTETIENIKKVILELDVPIKGLDKLKEELISSIDEICCNL